ncbi:MAG TPA: RNase adapter RapZ [Firmicutes bacterium]|nr:RNase adapter RapZ [Bacillota bacterium]HWR55862.1 RNase adapter RapZ [Negativicutes bacterium]
MYDVQLVIITGMSGAGKTQVVRCMEDLGFFCVDNLPPMLIPKFADLCAQSEGKVNKIALVVDIRGGEFFDTLHQVLEELHQKKFHYDIVFLEAADETLIRRYKESRRRHPLALQGRLLEGIRREREKLAGLRQRATQIIDTTNLTTAQLRSAIESVFAETGEIDKMPITIVSFGYKFGIPLDADLVFDVRFLPNPFYVEALRSFSGCEPSVREYIWKWPITQKFLEKMHDLVDFLIPHYVKEGRRQLIIAIGCTGGMHRSVAMANALYELLRKQGYNVFVEHRDIPKNLQGAGR